MRRGGNVVRIIGGEHRGRKISFVPVGGLRPTPDRVRETLFNWLRADVSGARCLDLFAGSGALGFEALSRGAASLTAVEQNRAAVQRLRDNSARLRLGDRMSVVHADALRVIRTPAPHRFDIVFLDPPFDDHRLERVCDALRTHDWVADRGLVYVEQDGGRPWPECPDGWEPIRESRAGLGAQRLLRCITRG